MGEGSGGFFKIRYYRVLLPLAILATVVGWGLEVFVEGGGDRFDAILLAGAALWFTVMALWLWLRPESRLAVEAGLCAGVVLIFAGRLFYAVYFMEPGASTDLQLAEFGFWLAPFFGLQFLWFGIEAGRRAALATLMLLILVPIPALIMGDLPFGSLYGLSMLILAGATSIFVYHVLGTTLIRYGAEKRAVEHLAVTDHLTGIANRRGLTARLSEELARTDRYGSRFSVLLLDLDRFKKVNDERGHQIGDQVLQEIAGILAAESREADTVGRWGGEEFLAVLPQVDADEATAVASRIRRSVAEHEFAGGVAITVSIGVAEARANESMDELVARADEALYAAKDAGRDRVETAP